jgi:shikimate kinase
MNIVLIGLKSCGKTSVGKALAAKLAKNFIDTDEFLLERHGKSNQSIRDIFQQEGEEHFRNLEKKVVATISSFNNAIVATGGGSIIEEENVKNLKKKGHLIYLDLSFEAWKSRIEQQPLPIFLRGKNLADHYTMRKLFYQKIADVMISVDQYSIRDIVDVVIKALSLQPSSSNPSHV